MCDRFPRKFDVQTSYKSSNYVLGLIFVVNIKFPRATYHTIVPSTEELYCLKSTGIPPSPLPFPISTNYMASTYRVEYSRP